MRALALPKWVDVVLEGGALTLERALLDYRALTRLLASARWERRGARVFELATAIAHTEFETLEREARARQRASIDPELAEAARLADAVSAARTKLCELLECQPTSLQSALGELAAKAEEAVLLARAHRQFEFERQVWTALGVGALSAGPFLSFLSESWNGVPVMFDPIGLLDSSLAVLAMLMTTLAAAVAQIRLESWSWLTDSRLSWVPTGLLCLVVCFSCLPITPLHHAVTGVVVFSACALLVLRSLFAWWRPRAQAIDS